MYKFILLAISIASLHLECNCQTVDVLFALNIGGPKYTSLSGIAYEANHEPMDFNSKRDYVDDLRGPDDILYKTYRFNAVNDDESLVLFNFSLPITGDGWHGLVLQMTGIFNEGFTGEYVEFSARINNHTILENYDPVTTRKCGANCVCDTVIYFSVCNGVFYHGGQSMEVHDKKLVLVFSKRAFLDAILLTKGVAGARQTVIPKKTELFFDPAQERKCVKS
jgi:Malectin domain